MRSALALTRRTRRRRRRRRRRCQNNDRYATHTHSASTPSALLLRLRLGSQPLSLSEVLVINLSNRHFRQSATPPHTFLARRTHQDLVGHLSLRTHTHTLTYIRIHACTHTHKTRFPNVTLPPTFRPPPPSAICHSLLDGNLRPI